MEVELLSGQRPAARPTEAAPAEVAERRRGRGRGRGWGWGDEWGSEGKPGRPSGRAQIPWGREAQGEPGRALGRAVGRRDLHMQVATGDPQRGRWAGRGGPGL